MVGNLHFKIDWASLTVGRKFTIFALYYFTFEAISKYKPRGGLYLEGRFKFFFFLRYKFGGLIFGGAYTWRGLFSELYGPWLETWGNKPKEIILRLSKGNSVFFIFA